MSPSVAPPRPAQEGLPPFVAAALAFAAVALLAYAGLRLAAAVHEPDPRTLGPSVHIAYYWRIGTALWWATIAAVGAARFPVLGTLAGRALPWSIVGAVGVAIFVP